nr:MAG TPA: holin [Caudoviricetes sp.]
MINWTVRIKNKNFWLAVIPAVLLLIQTVAAVFGYTMDVGDIGNRLVAVVNAVFGVLVILGVVNDPTTAGISDSKQARTYISPKED